MTSKEYIKDIILNGTAEDKRSLFAFTVEDANEKILKKFRLYARSNFPRYFKYKDAPYHTEMVNDYIDSYKGIQNVLDAAHRDAAKTSLIKLFIAFVIQNDTGHHQKYIKVLSKDLANSKQIVTDVYNLMVETSPIYGDQFAKEGKIKREETQGSFTTKDLVKLTSGTVGQDQRGHLQDAYRPTWVIFEDVESSTSVASQVITQGIIIKCQEAIDGLAQGARYIVNCNYISEDGVIQWFMNKPSVRTRLMPIAKEVEYGSDENGKRTLTKATPLWSRFTFDDLNEKYKDSIDWFGEFMCDPARSDNKFFSIDSIDQHIKNHAKPPERTSAGVKYWASYLPHHRYGQGSDHSEGIGEDANTLAGFDFTTGELIYTHASNTMSPDLATHEYNRVGKEFGYPIYAPEVNNKCGGIVITTLKDLNYPNIYRYEIKDKFKNVLSNKIGWETNSRTKTTMFMDFRTAWNDGQIIIYDEDVLKEMRAYSTNDLVERTTGLITRHFDLLTAVVIAWQMKDHATSKDDDDDDDSWGEYQSSDL
jgi:hypothetical protein